MDKIEFLRGIGVDSFDMWSALSRGQASPRREIVFNLDQDPFWGTWSAAIRMGRYKLLWGQHKLLKTQVVRRQAVTPISSVTLHLPGPHPPD